MGFAVERVDPEEDERFFMKGFKVFRSVIPEPNEETEVSTFEHPIQSFVWDDFTGKPGRKYTYRFCPLRGKPKNLNRSAKPIPIEVETEKLFDEAAEHQIFFNRGVAGSQAYVRRFGRKGPELLTGKKKQEALDWLSRDLDKAMLAFIQQAGEGDTLLGCFYEFRYQPVAEALREKAKKADVRIIIDAKENPESFPRKDNLGMVDTLKFPAKCILRREARTSAIQHNKFMVWMRGKGAAAKPAAVWSGSTNLSMGGVHGQTNVGHWVRNNDVAEAFRQYWEILAQDPGGGGGDSASDVRKKNKAFRQSVMALGEIPVTLEDIPDGITPVFSPREGLAVLDAYANLVDEAETSSAVTLAFGVSKTFKDKLVDNTSDSQITFLLLEKRDKPKEGSEHLFVKLTAANNVYSAWGSHLKDPLFQWVQESNAGLLKLNKHVSFIHSKFLLRDPLGDDPIVVTGSANFSDDSTRENDENMLMIRGDRRVADIYFTEFNRLWNHYYFRSVREALAESGAALSDDSLFLAETDEWVTKYASPKALRSKRLGLYTGMAV